MGLLLLGAGAASAPAAPVVVSATIASDGKTITRVYSVAVDQSSGAGFSLTDGSNSYTETYVSGSGTDTITSTVTGGLVLDGDTVTSSYSATTGNVASTSGGIALASYSDTSVANDSGVVFLDTFTRANSSLGGVGNGWTDSNSAWEILSDQLYNDSGNYLQNPITRDPGINYASGYNYSVEWDLANYNGGVSAVICVRGASIPTQFLGFYCGATSSGSLWVGSDDQVGGWSANFKPDQVASGGSFKIIAWCCGDITAFAIYPPGATQPLNAIGADPFANTMNSEGPSGLPPDRTEPYYTNTEIGLTAFATPNQFTRCQINKLMPQNVVFVFGTSITCYDGSPSGLTAIMGLNYRFYNFGYPSQTMAYWTNNFNTYIAPLIALAIAAGQTAYVIMEGGTNDIEISPGTAAELEGYDATLIGQINAAGVPNSRIGRWTILYRADSFTGGVYNTYHQGQADTFNAVVRSSYSTTYPGITVIDQQADTRLINPYNTFAFNTDQVHPTPGYGMFCTATNTALALWNVEPYVPVPAVAFASINAAGTTLQINFTTPVTGTTGFALTTSSGTTLTYLSGSGTAQYFFTLGTTETNSGDTPTLAYTPGNVAGTNGSLAAFSGFAVANYVQIATAV